MTEEAQKPPRYKSPAEVLLSLQRAASPQIERYVQSYLRQTIQELGGLKNLSAGVRSVLQLQKITLTICLCVEDQLCNEEKLKNALGRPNPLLDVLLKYSAAFTKNQRLLWSMAKGLSDRLMSLEDVKQEYERKAAEKEKEKKAQPHLLKMAKKAVNASILPELKPEGPMEQF